MRPVREQAASLKMPLAATDRENVLGASGCTEASRVVTTMSVTDQKVTTARKQARRAPAPRVSESKPDPVTRVVDRSRSQQTGLAFQVILALAACMALIGVVAEADTGPSVNDAPPAVFVQAD